MLHWGILSSITWSSLAFFHLLIADELLGTNKRYKTYCTVGYGAPLLCVLVTSAVDHTVYGGDDM